MKKRVMLNVSFVGKLLDELYATLREHRVDDYRRIPFIRIVEVRFKEGDARIEPIRTRLVEFGYRVSEVTRCWYSRADIEGSRACIVHLDIEPRSLQPAENYDLAMGCPECGAGAELSQPLELAKRDLPKQGLFAQTIEHYHLCTGALREMLLSTGASTDDFLPTRVPSATGTEWWLVWPRMVLPRLDASTEGLRRSDECAQCGRDGFFESLDHDLMPRISEKLPSDLILARTWEHFGKSNLTGRDPKRGRVAAVPKLCVSPKIAAMLYGMKRVQLIPIM